MENHSSVLLTCHFYALVRNDAAMGDSVSLPGVTKRATSGFSYFNRMNVPRRD
jgi:hypothetical protein